MCLSFSQFRISYTRVFDKLICETVLSTYSQRYADEKLSSDARFQSESAPGLTDSGLAYAASAKSLRLLSAVSCARISWFTRSFRLPRPASPISTAKVETVHPHGCGKHCRLRDFCAMPLCSCVLSVTNQRDNAKTAHKSAGVARVLRSNLWRR